MNHLNDQQVLALVNGEYLPDAARHAAGCPQCSAEVGRLTGSLDLFRESLQAMPAWRPRPLETSPRPVLRWAAAIAATAAMAATLMVIQHQEKARQAEEMARQDAALMDQLFYGTARVTPVSFERFNQLATTEGKLQ